MSRRHLRAHDPHNAIHHLAPMAAAPDDLWSKIDARIDGAAQPRGAGGPQMLVGAVGGLAIAASLAILAQIYAPTSTRFASAQLTHDGQAYRLIASPQPDRQTIVSLTSDGLAAPSGKSLEVWYVPQDGSAPNSLGLAQDGGVVSAHVLPGGDWSSGVMAISVEDSGGSRSGAPEGPVVATAPLRLFF